MSTRRKTKQAKKKTTRAARAPGRPSELDSLSSPAPQTADELGAAESTLHLRLGQRVRAAREQRFMTRKQLSQQSGISLAYLARVESGTGNISLALLHQLGLALGLPIASFLTPEEPLGADFSMIVEFLKRQPPERLAQIRRALSERRDAGRIALVGIRGVGKSTLGPMLAERLGVPFVELNREIEKKAKLRVDEIHTVYGQRGYRRLERECLDRIIAEYPRVVLATGGGIVAEAATYELLLASFYTIWLKAMPQIMFERVLGQHDARIASAGMQREAIDNITRTLEARRHLYELAHATYDTSGESIEQVVADLLELRPLAKSERGAKGRREELEIWSPR
ncbi:MAG TPA: helix-turn-helix transcriptional regulator [Polyangiaceae bacterium]|jgi:XRE family aerobic/anaerobic benzoate catabolism transcriptional regulator|nr:helix-turn-helix transcriptional regulator [Polyangiaceae bacterium]